MTQATLTNTNGIHRVPRGVLNLLLGMLFAGLVAFVGAWAAIVWNSARASELKNVEQDGRLMQFERTTESIDKKLNILIERGK